jgi:hypothetical protein
MVAAGGATQRMKIVLRCAVVFIAGMVYSMAWHDALTRIFGWEGTWVVVTVFFGIGSVWLGRRWFATEMVRNGIKIQGIVLRDEHLISALATR